MNQEFLQTSYPVMEHFYTLQGEGRYSGRAAYFVRLGGCDVGCVWCDVKESWDASIHPVLTVEEILKEIESHAADFVVITGGEPAMYDLIPLVEVLHRSGKYVAIETSGAHRLKGAIDWYTFSPKKFKAPVDEAYEKASELKVVIYNKSDFEWAKMHASRVHPECLLYIQPEWSKQERLLPDIIAFVKENPNWRLSLQTHKYLNIP